MKPYPREKLYQERGISVIGLTMFLFGELWPLLPLHLTSLPRTALQRGERASSPTQVSRGQPALVNSSSWPFILGFLMLGDLSALLLGALSLGCGVRLAVAGWASGTGSICLIRYYSCGSSSHMPMTLEGLGQFAGLLSCQHEI